LLLSGDGRIIAGDYLGARGGMDTAADTGYEAVTPLSPQQTWVSSAITRMAAS